LNHSTSFNPVLGFLSVSTIKSEINDSLPGQFQSRAGFSECLDAGFSECLDTHFEFQSRAGFSECLDTHFEFQSRAGFSECLDNSKSIYDQLESLFQSRAGFSECLDRR